MKLVKILSLLVAMSSVSAMASEFFFYSSSGWKALPECGGLIKLQIQQNGDANVILKDVKSCSNFDIVSGTYSELNYSSKKIQGENGDRDGSFTIPRKYINYGVNDVTIVVKSNSGKHKDTVNLVFLAR